MSISLPNGTLLAPSSSQATVSAAVTRILHLSNFSAELKTRDIQAIFREYENEKGGFRIKWVDDVNALVVFTDATVAKKAYLSLLLNPPPTFLPPATIRPYDKPDASTIIASLAARTIGHRSSMSNALSQSLPSTDPTHVRTHSTSNGGGFNQSFQMPLSNSKHRASTSSISGISGLPTRGHQRTGSASSSWARSGFNGTGGGGVLNFSMPTSSTVSRLPTHSESSAISRSPSSSTSEGEPIVIMDSALPRTGTKIPSSTTGGRRESVSADRALQEVKKALASVEAAG